MHTFNINLSRQCKQSLFSKVSVFFNNLLCMIFLPNLFGYFSHKVIAESLSAVGSAQDLRTGGRWLDPRHGQYPFRGFMIVILTGFVPR